MLADACAPAIPGLASSFLRQRPDKDGWAFFLDLDGTLIDIAPRPQDVTCPSGLSETLATLDTATGGAVAIVTGRSGSFACELLGRPDLTIAGLHGADIRLGLRLGGGRLTPQIAPERILPPARHAAERAAALPGVIFEDKQGAFALHFRLAPRMEATVNQIMQEALALAGKAFCLKPGKAVVELCPATADKGAALRRLMQQPAFRDRRPFAAGDDLTDEAMFAAAVAMGGAALRVGRAGPVPTRARYQVSTPAVFRRLLSQVAQGLG